MESFTGLPRLATAQLWTCGGAGALHRRMKETTVDDTEASTKKGPTKSRVEYMVAKAAAWEEIWGESSMPIDFAP